MWLKELHTLSFLNMTQRIATSWFMWLQELNLFFFDMWLKELNLFFFDMWPSKNRTSFFIMWLKELHTFFLFLNMTQRIVTSSFSECDSKNWTLVFKHVSMNWTPFMTQRIELFFFSIWLKKNVTFNKSMFQRIEHFFIWLKDFNALFFSMWLKDFNALFFSMWLKDFNSSFLFDVTQRIEPFSLNMCQ